MMNKKKKKNQKKREEEEEEQEEEEEKEKKKKKKKRRRRRKRSQKVSKKMEIDLLKWESLKFDPMAFLLTLISSPASKEVGSKPAWSWGSPPEKKRHQ